MAVGRRVVIMYLLAVWCCADTLVVQALLPSSFQSHSEPAIASGDPLMAASQFVTLPQHCHHHQLSSPDFLKQPETLIRVDSMTGSDPRHSVITGGVCPCNSSKAPRMKDRDDERWEERRKLMELERGDSSAGGRRDLVVIDVREEEGAGSADAAAEYAKCLDKMRAEARAGGVSTRSSGNECGHRFHTDTACSLNLELCPLRQCSHTGTPAAGLPVTVLPDHSPSSLFLPDGLHAPIPPDSSYIVHSEYLCCRLTRGHSLFPLTAASVGVVLFFLNLFVAIKHLVNLH